MRAFRLAFAVAASMLPSIALSGCPFSGSSNSEASLSLSQMTAPPLTASQLPDFSLVREDIVKLLTNSQDFWPADQLSDGTANYGPFLVRQAWHCAGSYRTSDGLGGCDGARQRFEPERSWADNTNLDKAKRLLWPVKQKYGAGLSWGDLIIFAANTAIESMGGPVLGFCAGRVDDADGSDSLLLGPTAEQAQAYPCAVNGQCQSPLGATTLGLIYVNPAGPMGVPDPVASAAQVRDTFGRMAMNDSETVALIGGGHAFGKAHGNCPLGPGDAPKEDPANPWQQLCDGRGNVTTSGFEGFWSFDPFKWSNQYFTNLRNGDWELTHSPAGNPQWQSKNNSLPGIMMLTSDLSLTKDASYSQLVDQFASDADALGSAFSHAWYKLTTRDMGPISRCLQAPGLTLPPAQPFQYPLPTQGPVNQGKADWSAVRSELLQLIHPLQQSSIITGDVDAAGKPYYGAMFVQLAYLCSATYRRSDYLGGCNGARIRYYSSWQMHAGMDKVLQLLQPLQQKYQDSVSLSDLIVFAGNVALEDATGQTLSFCAGRVDVSANDGGWENLRYSSSLFNYSSSADAELRLRLGLIGLTPREFVALAGRPRSAQLMALQQFSASSWSTNPSQLTNEFYNTLLNNDWSAVSLPNGVVEFETAANNQLRLTPSDLVLKYAPDFQAIVQEFATDGKAYQTALASAWTKLMNADRFVGPGGNTCAQSSNSGNSDNTAVTSRPWFVAAVSVAGTALAAAAVFWFCLRTSTKSTSSRDGTEDSVNLLK